MMFLRVILLAFILCAFPVPLTAYAQSTSGQVTARQQELQRQLDLIESQIGAQQRLLDIAEGQHRTLQSQIDAFNAEIRKTELEIKAIDLSIQQLSAGISEDNEKLASLSEKLTNEQESLAEILRKTQILDDYSVVEVGLSSEDVSSFFADLDAFVSIKSSLYDSFEEIRTTSAATKDEKEKLEAKRTDEQALKSEQKLAQRALQAQQKEKQQLLAATKGLEANYQKVIAASQKTAAQIRSELFTLRDSAAIPFGTALAYAEAAQKATGVRAAVTLGVLKQETNLGENLGTGTWTVDMHPTRDRPVFPYITTTLGLDPNQMPVSKKPSYGWGGAMGPGQFIPSTWVCYAGFVNTGTGDCNNARGSISMTEFWQGPWQYVASKDRVRKLLGTQAPSNPWDAKTAIMATAMLMADNGAAAGTYTAERLAALRYFAGWTNATKRAYAFYGDGVMEFATKFQEQINILHGS